MAMAVIVPVAVTTTVGAGGLSLSLVVGTQEEKCKKKSLIMNKILCP